MNNHRNYKQELATNGWFVARAVLSVEDIITAIDRIRCIAEQIELFQHLPNIVPSRFEHSEDPIARFEWIDAIALHDQQLWQIIAAHPRLLAIARAVLGEQVFPTNGCGFFLKPPGSDAHVPWHQDASPFASDPPPLLFDFWLGLSPATKDMGCLHLIPGSHTLGRLVHRDTANALHPFVDIAELGFGERDIIAIETQPGDLIVWHQDMLHGSPPNAGNEPRIAIAGVYHGSAQEQQLRSHHRSGAIRVRPQLCYGHEIFSLPEQLNIGAHL